MHLHNGAPFNGTPEFAGEYGEEYAEGLVNGFNPLKMCDSASLRACLGGDDFGWDEQGNPVGGQQYPMASGVPQVQQVPVPAHDKRA